tara:strand:+ start:47 stop:325 length:279 start_codon:yes stop_codon:yes gene_type:complete
MPVHSISIHTDGVTTSDWIVVDPDLKPKDGDKVLIKDTNRLLLLTFYYPFYLAGQDSIMDLAMYDMLGTVIRKDNKPMLGENYYAEVDKTAL